jgi:hypothetical protein
MQGSDRFGRSHTVKVEGGMWLSATHRGAYMVTHNHRTAMTGVVLEYVAYGMPRCACHWHKLRNLRLAHSTICGGISLILVKPWCVIFMCTLTSTCGCSSSD